MRLPSLFVLTDCHLVQDLRGAVIVRDYDHPQREKYARDILKQAKGPVLIAGDITLARRVKAEGLHVPQWQLSRLPQRIFCPPGWLITAACHSLKAIKQAQQNPMIQAVLVSPVFATISHPHQQPLGVIRFGLIVRQSRLPVIALGGIKRAQIHSLRQWGAAGIALRSEG